MEPLATRSFSLPSWLGGRSVGWTTVFAGLFLFTTSCRTIIISIIPIKAFSYLGNAHAVSVLFFAASTIGVCSSVLIPVLLRRIGARGVFYAAALAGLLGPVLLGLPSFPVFLIGMVVWVFSTLAFEVSTSLYVMHHIRRRDLGSFECGYLAAGNWREELRAAVARGQIIDPRPWQWQHPAQQHSASGQDD